MGRVRPVTSGNRAVGRGGLWAPVDGRALASRGVTALHELSASALNPRPRDFAGVVSKLLDEFDAADFRSAERILEAIRRQGRTISGYPRVRPGDCDRVIRAIRTAFEANRPLFVTGDSAIIRRFDEILEAFAETDLRFYPRELMRARTLHAETKLLLNDPAGVRRLIGEYADRLYKIEGNRRDITLLMRLDCQGRVAVGEIDGLGRTAIARALSLSRLWPLSVASTGNALIEFVGLEHTARPRDGFLASLLCRSARMTARARIAGGSIPRRAARAPIAWFGLSVAAACLFFLRRGDVRLRRRQASDDHQIGNGDVVVSRAMGGIGDLFVMTPGLRALAKRHSTRVKLVIERKYFDIFRNNPHVEVIDIDGSPVDVSKCKAWYNLTLCPAARYESSRRPFVKRGRAELFARGMGVGKRLLDRHGWEVEYVLDDGQIAFRDEFVRDARLGGRPIVGVQPYSRDTYKDHPEIGRFVKALSADYDIIIFHHLETGFPAGPGIASTAGLALAESIALVSALDAMVCVDSGFLHAAGAFDVPVVAMFGPTDGKLFTRHLRHATVICANESFACAPCWRNEDLPCQVTRQVGTSPCVAALKVEAVQAAVAEALRERPAKPRVNAAPVVAGGSPPPATANDFPSTGSPV
jgi:ADP-heptose:LPS heptosyltransferase